MQGVRSWGRGVQYGCQGEFLNKEGKLNSGCRGRWGAGDHLDLCLGLGFPRNRLRRGCELDSSLGRGWGSVGEEEVAGVGSGLSPLGSLRGNVT